MHAHPTCLALPGLILGEELLALHLERVGLAHDVAVVEAGGLSVRNAVAYHEGVGRERLHAELHRPAVAATLQEAWLGLGAHVSVCIARSLWGCTNHRKMIADGGLLEAKGGSVTDWSNQ